MVSKERKAILQYEAERIRQKYSVETVRDLTNVAKGEYGVADVVRTSAIVTSAVVPSNGQNYIFLKCATPQYRRLALSHEMGHIAAGHLDNPRETQGVWGEELEADYFAAKVNGISVPELWTIRCLDGLATIPIDLVQIVGRKRELQRLRDLGFGELIKQNADVFWNSKAIRSAAREGGE